MIAVFKMIIGFNANAKMSQWPSAPTPKPLNGDVSEHQVALFYQQSNPPTHPPTQWVERQKEEGEYNPLWEQEENFGRQADCLSRQRVVNKEMG